MLRTLFFIPHAIWGIPLFGYGWLLGVWLILSAILLGWLVWRQGWSDQTRGYLPVLALMGLAIVFLLPVLEEKGVSGSIGLPIRGYGMMLLAGVVAGVALANRRARQMGVHPDHILSMAFWMFVAGILGARLFYVIEFWDDFRHDSALETLREIINVVQGGLVVYGALIGGLIAALLYIRSHGLPMLAVGDLIAPSLVLGLAFGRIGCLLNGCCFGNACQQTWALTFPVDSPPYQYQLGTGQLHGFRIGRDDPAAVEIVHVDPESQADRAGLRVGDQLKSIGGIPVQSSQQAWDVLSGTRIQITIETKDSRTMSWSIGKFPGRSRPVHPTQIYSTIHAVLLCLFLVAYYPFRRRDGEVFALLLTIYSVARFLLEMIRSDDAIALGLTISQLVSLLLFFLALGLWFHIARQPPGSLLPGKTDTVP